MVFRRLGAGCVASGILFAGACVAPSAASALDSAPSAGAPDAIADGATTTDDTQLPATGDSSLVLGLSGFAVLALGAGLIGLQRKRPSSNGRDSRAATRD